MNLPQWAVKHRAICYSAVGLAMLYGVVSFFTMPRREDPEFTIRTCVVATQWPGIPATRVEQLITDKIEEVLEGIEEVDQLRSTTVTGQSTIFIDCEDSIPASDIQNVWDKVRAKVNLVEMPEPEIRPIVNDEFGDTAVIVLAVHQTPFHQRKSVRIEDEYSPRELEQFADTVKDSLRLLPGVASVNKYGVRDEAIFIESDLGTWANLGLTASQLKTLVDQRNIIRSGGDLNTTTGKFSVAPGGKLIDTSEIESIIVGGTVSDGQQNPVYLSDLGLRVKRAYDDPPKIIARYGDHERSAPAVMLGVTMKSGSNIIDVCSRVRSAVDEIQNVRFAVPADIAVTPVSDQSENVDDKISGVVVNVIEAILIVIVVVFLVVGFRSAFVMAANIPVVVLASIGLITFFGVQLEQISLASIIIALGLLVDNAVQVCDQSRSNQIDGMKPIKASVEAAKTLATPMLIGTLTTVAAFLPMLVALQGGGKEYVYSLPVTLSVCLGLSWILAMSFCVLLASLLIRPPRKGESGSPLASLAKLIPKRKSLPGATESNGRQPLAFRWYEWFAGIAIKAKWLTIAVTLVLFIVAVKLPVASEFFPKDRRDQFAVKVWLPETATIHQTDAKTRQVEEIIRTLAARDTGEYATRLRGMRSLVGGGGSRWHLSWQPEASKSNYAEILVRTSDGTMTPQFAADIRRAAEFGDKELGIRPITGARVVPVEMALGPPADPVAIRITGDGFADIKTLRSAAEIVSQLVKQQSGTWDVADDWGIAAMQLTVNVDEERANLAGVNNAQVAETLNTYFSGLRLTTFREGDHLIPVYFRLDADDRSDISKISAAYVEGSQNKIPLSAIAKTTPMWTPATVARRDMNRSITVGAQVDSGTSGNDVVKAVMESDELKQLQASLPAGFRVEIGGALEESADSAKDMLTSFGISFMLIVMCLIIQYNGWAKPMIILATLPMSLIGALPGLYLTGNPIGFMPQLGILSLFGIVLNTGIIFIEFADQLIAERLRAKRSEHGSVKKNSELRLTNDEFRSCLLDAGKQRMLPIFLTTATTVGGLFPLALGGGPLWEGLAWCMICGLLVATVLTLIVVPAIYAIMVETLGITPVRLEEE